MPYIQCLYICSTLQYVNEYSLCNNVRVNPCYSSDMTWLSLTMRRGKDFSPFSDAYSLQ